MTFGTSNWKWLTTRVPNANGDFTLNWNLKQKKRRREEERGNIEEETVKQRMCTKTSVINQLKKKERKSYRKLSNCGLMCKTIVNAFIWNWNCVICGNAYYNNKKKKKKRRRAVIAGADHLNQRISDRKRSSFSNWQIISSLNIIPSSTTFKLDSWKRYFNGKNRYLIHWKYTVENKLKLVSFDCARYQV